MGLVHLSLRSYRFTQILPRMSLTPSASTPDQVEDRLLSLGRRIDVHTTDALNHPGQEALPEWRGADVIVTSDFAWQPRHVSDEMDLVVRTRHARSLTWLFFELRDAFGPWLDATNKYGFFGALADAALKHLAANQPEENDARPLLRAVLSPGFEFLAILRKDSWLPPNATIILHSTDAEGRQLRVDGETGEGTL